MSKPIRARLDGELDKTLLRMVKDGTTIVTKDGEAVKIDAPHQILEVARKRLSDLESDTGVGKNSDAERLAAELTKKDFEMHDVPDSDEQNAAIG